MRLSLALAAVALSSIMGCQALPDVTWASDDAGGEDGSGPPPGGDAAFTGDATFVPDAATGAPDATLVETGAPAQDAASDAGLHDSGSDTGAPVDAGVDAPLALGCPGAPPLGATYCCGATPCSGPAGSCPAMCTNCENDCKIPGGTCCLDGNGNYHGCALDCSTL